MKLEPRPCPICKTSASSTPYRASTFDETRWNAASFSSRKMPEYMHFALLTCGICSLVYASPVPPLDVLGAAYRDATFEAGRESRLAARTYIGILESAAIPPGKALDIGAADGAFLRELRSHGYTDVVGVEPSEAPVRSAQDDVRPFIRQELFDGELFPPETFDLVSCFQTIEHVYEPRALLEDIHRVLAPGGTAFLIAHDVHALSAKLLGARSPIFDIEHMQLFNRRSLRYVLERVGFTNVRVFPIWNAYPFSYWLKLFPLPGGMKTRALAAFDGGPLGALGSRMIAVPAGNLGVFGTKK